MLNELYCIILFICMRGEEIHILITFNVRPSTNIVCVLSVNKVDQKNCGSACNLEVVMPVTTVACYIVVISTYLFLAETYFLLVLGGKMF